MVTTTTTASTNDGQRICCVCLEGKADDAAWVRLDGCGHELCLWCLQELERKSAAMGLAQACPTCRFPLPRVLRAEARGLEYARRALVCRHRKEEERELLTAAAVALRSAVDSTRERMGPAAYALGVCLAELGSTEDAARAFERASQTKELECEAKLASATLDLERDRGKTKIEAALRLAEARKETHVAFDAAILLSKVSLRTEAKPVLGAAYAKRASKFASTSRQRKRASFELGLSLESLGDLAAADDAYRRSLPTSTGQDASDLDSYLESRGFLSDSAAYRSSSEDSDSRQEEDNANSDSEDSTSRPVRLPYSRWRVGRRDFYDDRGSGLLYLGTAQWRHQGSPSGAVRALMRAAARRARLKEIRSTASLRLGLLEVGQKSIEGARRASRALKRATRGCASRSAMALAYTKLGEAHFALGNYGKAERALRAALNLEPNRVDTLLRLAATLQAVAQLSVGGSPFQVQRYRTEAQKLRRHARARVVDLRIATTLFTVSETAAYPMTSPTTGHTTLEVPWLPTLETNSHANPNDDDDDDDEEASTYDPAKTLTKTLTPLQQENKRPTTSRNPAHLTRADRAALVTRLRLQPPDTWMTLLSSPTTNNP